MMYFFAGMLGNAYKTYGFDSFEEDYFELTPYEAKWAQDISKQRLMGLTKEKILSVARQCIVILMCMLDIRHTYDCLKSTLDILRDERAEVMKTVKSVVDAYEEWQKNPNDREKIDLYEKLLKRLPDAVWVQ